MPRRHAAWLPLLAPLALAACGGASPAARMAVTSADDWVSPRDVEAAPAGTARALAAPPRAYRAVDVSVRLDRPRFAGTPIDVDLEDADLHNVFRMLADVGRANIVVADDVGGSVTLKLRHVPWDEVMYAVARIKGLRIERDGSIYYVTSSGSAAGARLPAP